MIKNKKFDGRIPLQAKDEQAKHSPTENLYLGL